MSESASLVLLVSCAGALGLAIGALIGWILRDRCERRPRRSTDRDPDIWVTTENIRRTKP